MTGRSAVMALIALAALQPAQAQFQENGERAAQARLPQGKAALWATLRQTKIGIDQAKGMFTANYPAPVKALAGKTVTLPGFLMPLDADEKSAHYLLSKYTPVCAFCPPGEPNEVVEVHTAKPIPYTGRLVTVTGRFALENKGENGLFFQMTGADVR